jgi:hypothetical protein
MLRPVMESAAGSRLVDAARDDPDLDPIREDPRFQAMIA